MTKNLKNKKILATSVYKGKISANNIDIKENEGFYESNGKIIKTILPLPVTNLTIQQEILTWQSNYKKFAITISKNKNFTNPPIFKYKTFVLRKTSHCQATINMEYLTSNIRRFFRGKKENGISNIFWLTNSSAGNVF